MRIPNPFIHTSRTTPSHGSVTQNDEVLPVEAAPGESELSNSHAAMLRNTQCVAASVAADEVSGAASCNTDVSLSAAPFCQAIGIDTIKLMLPLSEVLIDDDCEFTVQRFSEETGRERFDYMPWAEAERKLMLGSKVFLNIQGRLGHFHIHSSRPDGVLLVHVSAKALV